MQTITQLSFDFTPSIQPMMKARLRVPWRVSALSRRYRMTTSQAAFYAAEMGVPDGRGDL